jgi:membrane associated rhomboid family serine protease
MNVAYFAIAVARGVSPIQPESQQLLDLGANFGPLIFAGQWWRLLSSTFVHIGFVHLALNMWCLWNLGNVAERMFGNFTFLWIYLACGLGGSLGSLLWNPSIVSAGASGAIFGIAGALASMLYFGHILVPREVVRQLLSSLLFFVGFNLLFGFLLQGIDNAGNIGGSPSASSWERCPSPLPLATAPRYSLRGCALRGVFGRGAGERDPDLRGERDTVRVRRERRGRSRPFRRRSRSTGVALLKTTGVFIQREAHRRAIAAFREAVELTPALRAQRNLAAPAVSGQRKRRARRFESRGS